MNVNFNKAEFKRSVGAKEQFVKDGLPQFAFAGRSNVGKSSVINRLLGRKNLAYVGASPGKTTQINYFLVDQKAYLVDLPGYGFARVSREESARWGRMIEKYLHTSQDLKAVFLLVDIRHAPGANDKMMYQWIVDSGFKPIIIATKLDKIKRSQVQKQLKLIRTTLEVLPDTLMSPFSSQTKQGRDEIWAVIDEFLTEEAPAEVEEDGNR